MVDWESTTPREDSDKYPYNNNGNTIDLTNNDEELERTIQRSLEDENISNNKMAVVLYNNPKNNSNSQVDDNYRSYNNWEQPIKRLKLDDTTPIGLKSNMNYGFAGPFFLALFHIPIFRLAILAYQPTRDDWGEVEGYWDGSSRGLSVEYDSNSYCQEFKSRPYTLKFMHEFQKLFGFLSLSQRAYGDASSLIDALAFEDNRSNWSNWNNDLDSVQDFFIKVLDVIVHSSTYHRDLIDLDPSIDSLSKHVIPFNRLLKSLGRNENFSNYHYQSEKREEDVLSIPLVITPSFNTVYSALDKIVHKTETMQKVFFTELAKILIFTLKHRDAYSFTSGDSGFQIHKELYMDRYLLNRAEDIEKRWHQLEILKSESEKINQAIRRITEYQGRHNGPDLLKGSIEYFRRKCDKARNNDITDNNAQKIHSFLEGILEKVEQKLKGLIENKERIEAEIRDIFNTPDMKKVVYRLKAVLGYDGQHHYAYIWVSGGNKTETISNNDENGNWWKFGDMTVEETSEERAFNDTSTLPANSNVYSLIYVNADADHNFSNINDIIPSSLKEYVNKDNNYVLNEEVQDNNNNYNDYNNGYYNSYGYDDNYNSNNNNYNDNGFNNNNDYNNDYYNNDYNQDVIMGDSSRTNSDSTAYDEYLKARCEITEKQEENIVPLHPNINKRFEIFCIKLGQIDLFKSLMHKFYETGNESVGGSWDEPHPLNTAYLSDPTYKEYVELFDKYKEITLYFTEGLDRVISDEYRNALAYFKHAIHLENDWINNLHVTDKGELVELNGEKLRRSKEIDAYAKACLKVEHDGFLSKIRDETYRTRGLKDGLQTLPYIVAYIGASNCAEDELFKRFRDEFKELIEEKKGGFTEEQQTLIHNLLEKYTQPEESLELKCIEEVEHKDLCERYEAALKKCSSGLKNYEVPHI